VHKQGGCGGAPVPTCAGCASHFEIWLEEKRSSRGMIILSLAAVTALPILYTEWNNIRRQLCIWHAPYVTPIRDGDKFEWSFVASPLNVVPFSPLFLSWHGVLSAQY